MDDERVIVRAVGDLIVDKPDPARFFAPSAPELSRADLTIGNLEVPHSSTSTVASVDIPAPPADPAHLSAVAAAGFDILTLAANHVYDCGPEGIADTVSAARRAGLATTGAGADLAAAKEPATVHRHGRSIAVLNYNCVGPRESWATSRKAGCAYVDVLTHYEMRNANPGGPPEIHTFCEPGSLRQFRADVTAAGQAHDIVIVALHKGLVHTPAMLADYEREVAHAAVDAGADAVIAHHAHILHGVEVYQGRPIFHGLGNFVTVTDALTPVHASTAEAHAWAARRLALFGFVPDPAMPSYPFHPDSRHTLIAHLEFDWDRVGAAFVPCWIDDEGRPVPQAADAGGPAVLDYVRTITAAAGLDTEYAWDGDLVRVHIRAR
ncbi:CapA family protein [Microbacterium protaetiae]|uniref:CapA family protein n=1 Tax=Microbacterium protaetiae TaxID=2509458 RepID=A0A4P6EDS2_9MICO|nr:CapA family protein [Microbacterium protaetiae]QAY60294.1 CapA family protein [Microbacterium protaetiae]